MRVDLPAEVWTQIFDLAADEDIIFQHGLPTVMAESAWYKDIIVDEWRLRSPQEAMNFLQRRSYAMKKAIISTCRRWRDLGSEFLFRCLYFSDPGKLISLCSILDSSSSTATTATASYGWWTRRIHISRLHPSVSRGFTMADMENALVSIVRHCPNLEVFIVERPMGPAFGPVVDALATYAFKKLQTVQWNIPGESLSKVIWALHSLPYIIAAQIDVETAVPSAQECANLGSATNLHLELQFLQQLSIRGFVEEFLEQATGWHMPALRSFSVDSGAITNDVPDVLEFVTHHGISLVILDINCNQVVDVPSILDLCPTLTTFTFNADWRLLSGDDSNGFTKRPHLHITTIGLHGLSYAFGVGYFADSAMRNEITRRNDLNMSALNKRNFPKLQRIRALSRIMLTDLNRADGPSTECDGYNRWNKWWHMCAASGISFEDCTGQSLGTLPQEEEDEESEDEEDEDEEFDSDEWESESEEEDEWGKRVSALPEANGRTMELTRLLQECRVMNEGRDEELIARIRIPRPPSPPE
ncbi:hypothetical protein B0H34DRAFT_658290 [Crassisporium funariophilum]|nr:hypothetical protein B0H34DRAFT_658290 [Crassisporium funariophilum]